MRRFCRQCERSLLLLGAAILACAAVGAAWDGGGGYYRTQLAVCLGLIPIACGICLRGAALGFRDSAPPAMAVVASLVWLGGFVQSVGLPEGTGSWFAGNSAALHAQWIPDPLQAEIEASRDPRIESFAASWSPLSVAPTYTRLSLAGPAVFAVVCWASFLLFRFPPALVLFGTAVVLGGAVFSLLGIADLLLLGSGQAANSELFITPDAGDPFGPFINNTHAAGFLNLTIGCLLGFVAPSFLNRTDPRAVSSGDVAWRGWTFVILVLLVLMISAVVASNSRGGFLGMLAGFLGCLFVVLQRQHFRKIVFSLVVLVAATSVIIGGLSLSDRFQKRMTTLTNETLLQTPRLDHWQDALTAASDYLPLGAGLGSYRYAYLPHQQQGGSMWFVNADGMPMEWLVEGGVWLLPLILVGVLLLVRDLLRVLSVVRANPDLPQSTAGLMQASLMVAAYCIPAVLVTQCFDFSITLFPVLIVFAAVCGLLAVARRLADTPPVPLNSNRPTQVLTRDPHGPAPASEQDSEQDSQPGSLLQRWVRVLRMKTTRMERMVGFCCCVFPLMALWMAANHLEVATLAQQQELRVARLQKSTLVDQPSFLPEIATLQRVVETHPDNSLAWRSLARLRLAEQERRGQVFLSSVDGETKAVHRRMTLPRTVRYAFYKADQGFDFSQLLLPEQEADQWQMARHELMVALLLNPLDDFVRVRLIELDMVQPDANLATEALLDQAALLRNRNGVFLGYLISLAETYPGKAVASRIKSLWLLLSQN